MVPITRGACLPLVEEGGVSYESGIIRARVECMYVCIYGTNYLSNSNLRHRSVPVHGHELFGSDTPRGGEGGENILLTYVRDDTLV